MVVGRPGSANRKWFTLGAVSFGLFMVMLDNTVVNVALPTISTDLHTSISGLEWVVSGYTLTFAVLMLTGGKLADTFGRRLVLTVGIVVFCTASLLCGLAGSAGMLVAARTVQGAGAALMSPATLSIITATFRREERGTAIGIWAGVSSIAIAIGPLVGGLITEHIDWSWVFFINVPIGALALVAVRLFVDESRDTETDRGLDLPGLLTSGAGLFMLTYALIEANSHGWSSPLIVGLFLGSAAALTAFVLLEARERRPMLDLDLFRIRRFTGANVTVLLVTFAMFGIVFYIQLYMQNMLGYSPVRAGTTQLPLTLLIIAVAPLAGKLTDLIGPRLPMTVGCTLIGLSLYLFSRLGLHAHFVQMLPGLIAGGLGLGLAMGPTSTAALSAVPTDHAGVGSGVLQTFRQTGGVLGVAVMGAILTAAIHVSPFDPRFPLQFVDGFQRALQIAAAISLVGAVVAALTIGERLAPVARPRIGRPAHLHGRR